MSMPWGRICHRLRVLAGAAVLLSLSTRVLSADSASESAVKAAFLYNFAKFSEWPSSVLAPGQRLSLCVMGDSAVADALEQIIRGHAVEGHELTAQVVKPGSPIRSCHLLFVGGVDAEGTMRLLESLKGLAVLTVGDDSRFIELGGIIQLIVEDGRMRFAVNITSARRAHVVLSSKLVSLARVIGDEHNVHR